LDTTQVRLSATGDVCLGLQADTQTISSNLCTNPITITNFKDIKTYNLIDTQKKNKAGTMVITAKFCIGGSPTKCISKSKSIMTLPAPVDKINIQIPTSIVMM